MLNDYFFARVVEAVGKDKAGGHFVAVTDPGSALEKTAKADRLRRVSLGQPNIGGAIRCSRRSAWCPPPHGDRYCAVARNRASHGAVVRGRCAAGRQSAVQLGIALGVAGREGRDKVTLFSSPKLVDFGAWAEQLISESTGKNGKGLIPIDAEPLGAPDLYGSDRFFIDLRTTSEADPAHDGVLDALRRAGHPLARIEPKSPEYTGREFFHFELAIAVAGAVIGINPFDQPDVETGKAKTRELTAAFEKTGALPGETPVAREGAIEVYTDAANAEALKKAGSDGGIESWPKAHFARLHPGDYAALLAYLAGSKEHAETLQKMRLTLRQRGRIATCLGFSPRFLHSTGQAYKGGPNSGVFLQITADEAADLAIPGHGASFGVIKAAQARGDFDVLAERGRRALRVHLKGDVEAGLQALGATFKRALA